MRRPWVVLLLKKKSLTKSHRLNRFRHPGVASAIGAAVLFGISTPLAKLAVSSENSILVAGLLYLGSGLGLSLLRLGRRVAGVRSAESPISKTDLPWLAGATLLGGVAAPVLLLAGLIHTSASSASLLLNLEAVATASIAWVVFRENVDKRVAAGFVFILGGAILLSIPSDSRQQFSGGSILIAMACLCWGIDNNLTRKVSAGDPGQIAMWKGIVAGAVNSGLALAVGAKLPQPDMLAGILTVGFLCYGVSLVLFVRSLRHLGTARTGAYFSTAPFAGAAFSFALGQGQIDWVFGIAGVLMIAGIWLHVTEKHEHQHTHQPLQHDHLHTHDEHHRHEHEPGDPPGEPHAHPHKHTSLTHSHPHYPDIHHQHGHERH